MAFWGKFLSFFIFFVDFDNFLHHLKDHTKEWFIHNDIHYE